MMECTIRFSARAGCLGRLAFNDLINDKGVYGGLPTDWCNRVEFLGEELPRYPHHLI